MPMADVQGRESDGRSSEGDGSPAPSIEEIRVRLLKWLNEGGSGIGRLCTTKIRDEALIIDQERLENQFLARIALGVQLLNGEPFTLDWLELRLDEAIGDLLRKDRERLDRGVPDAFVCNDAGAFLVEGIGIGADEAHSRVVAYNALPPRVRRAFFAVCIDLVEFDDLVGTEWRTEKRLRDDLLAALEAILDKSRSYKRDQT